MILHRVQQDSTTLKRKEKARAKIRRAEMRRAKHFKEMSELKQGAAINMTQCEEAKALLELKNQETAKYKNLYEQALVANKSSATNIQTLEQTKEEQITRIAELQGAQELAKTGEGVAILEKEVSERASEAKRSSEP